MAAVRVKMLSDGFIEGRRRREGEELFVYQPHLVSFRSMELFDKSDVELVKKAHADHAKARKNRKKHSAVVVPQIVDTKTKEEPMEEVRIDPDTGIPLNVSTEVGLDGKPAGPIPGQPAVPLTPGESVI